jgi:hypothetical protein
VKPTAPNVISPPAGQFSEIFHRTADLAFDIDFIADANPRDGR